MWDIEKEIISFFSERNFEKSRRFTKEYKYSTLPIKSFLNELNNPQFNYKTVHIAGTVAKGSVAIYFARIFANAKYKTGLYTSPHLINLRERIQINETTISENSLQEIWKILKKNSEKQKSSRATHQKKNVLLDKISFFDALTIISFMHFHNNNIDWAVIETGLGGRMDSTNVVKPALVILTPIELDHQITLGNSIELIAREKAGIIKNKTLTLSFPQQENVKKILMQRALDCNSDILFFRVQNKQEEIQEYNASFSEWASTHLLNTKSEFKKSIKGRFELLSLSPKIYFDSSHNLFAIKAFMHWIKNMCEAKKQLVIIINVMLERDLSNFITEIQKTTPLIYLWETSSQALYKEKNLSKLDKLNLSGVIHNAQELNSLTSQKNRVYAFCGSMRLYAHVCEFVSKNTEKNKFNSLF